jgi:hypothetical protein
MVREGVLTLCQRIAVERTIQEYIISVLIGYLIPTESRDILPNRRRAASEILRKLFTSQRHTLSHNVEAHAQPPERDVNCNDDVRVS